VPDLDISQSPSNFWIGWLTLATLGVSLFGIALVIFPDFARQGFSLLVYFDAGHLSSLGEEVINYVALLHAVLGSVMFGWGIALLIVVRKLYANGSRLGWQIVAVSVLVWFVPDTTFSLWSGFWQNALLNLSFLVLFLVPLVATFKEFHDAST
jgi:hypothetical protein